MLFLLASLVCAAQPGVVLGSGTRAVCREKQCTVAGPADGPT